MKYMALAVLVTGIGWASGATALESVGATPEIRPGEANRNIQANVSSTIIPAVNAALADISKTIICAQQSKVYNKETGQCVGPNASSGGNVTPSRLTGPFSQVYATPGTYTFVVPANYVGLSVYVYGSGGSCTVGTASSFGSATPVVANGGGAGYCSTSWKTCYAYPTGPAGTASGGDVNLSGVATVGAMTCNGSTLASSFGGFGGFSRKDFVPGTPGAPGGGSSITVKVGTGGDQACVATSPRYPYGCTAYAGGAAGPGKVAIYWMKNE